MGLIVSNESMDGEMWLININSVNIDGKMY